MKRQNLTQEAKKVMWAAMAMSVLMTTPCFAGSLMSTPMVQAQTEMVPAAPISESDLSCRTITRLLPKMGITAFLQSGRESDMQHIILRLSIHL